MLTSRPVNAESMLLLVLVTWVFWMGCDRPELQNAELDYIKRTVSIQEVLINKPCTLGTSPATVSTGWVPVHFIFDGDEEIIEGVTAPFIRIQILDPQGDAIETCTPELVDRKDSSTFLFASFFKIQPEHRGRIGRVELFGNEQLLLIRKLFRVQ
ncbi:MAG: hypothetical protein FJ308_03780 [Planctomycetes bacterium]|nr:hypothetical protein [Planctomycetota bacterium]